MKNLRFNLLCISMLLSSGSVATTFFSLNVLKCSASESDIFVDEDNSDSEIVLQEDTNNEESAQDITIQEDINNEEIVVEPETTELNQEIGELSNPINGYICDENNMIVISEYLTYDMTANVYITNEQLINNDKFVLTTNHETYEYLPDENFLQFLCTVACETDGSFIGALSDSTSVLNRCRSAKWKNYLNSKGYDGTNPIDQIRYPGQYVTYKSDKYYKYYNGELEIPAPVLAACKATWYGGIRNHNYCSFRAKGCKSYSDNQIVANGNRYKDEVVAEQQVEAKEDEKVLVK